MDLATLTNAPRTLRIGGLDYKVRALTFAEWGTLHGWLRDNVDDPVTEALRQVEKARAKGVAVSPEAEGLLLRSAREDAKRWPPTAMTGQWFALLGTCPGGSSQFLLAMLRPLQPSITDEQVAGIEAAMTSEEVDAIIAAALGRDPAPKDGPPAGGEETTTTVSPKSPRSRTTGRPRSSASSRPA